MRNPVGSLPTGTYDLELPPPRGQELGPAGSLTRGLPGGESYHLSSAAKRASLKSLAVSHLLERVRSLPATYDIATTGNRGRTIEWENGIVVHRGVNVIRRPSTKYH